MPIHKLEHWQFGELFSLFFSILLKIGNWNSVCLTSSPHSLEIVLKCPLWELFCLCPKCDQMFKMAQNEVNAKSRPIQSKSNRHLSGPSVSQGRIWMLTMCMCSINQIYFARVSLYLPQDHKKACFSKTTMRLECECFCPLVLCSVSLTFVAVCLSKMFFSIETKFKCFMQCSFKVLFQVSILSWQRRRHWLKSENDSGEIFTDTASTPTESIQL